MDDGIYFAPQPRPRKKVSLGQMLLQAGDISEAQLNIALSMQEGWHLLIGEALVRLKFCSDRTVAMALSEQTGIPYVDGLLGVVINRELLMMIPGEVCRKFRLLPLGTEGAILRVAMANPFDVAAVDFVRNTTGHIPFPSIAPSSEIEAALDRHFHLPK